MIKQQIKVMGSWFSSFIYSRPLTPLDLGPEYSLYEEEFDLLRRLSDGSRQSRIPCEDWSGNTICLRGAMREDLTAQRPDLYINNGWI